MSGKTRTWPGSSRREKLKKRMILQTENYIDRHLQGQGVPWPRRYKPSDRGRGNGELMGRAEPAAATGAVRVRPSQFIARVIELHANERGHLDKTRVRELESLLISLACPGQRGHVVIDLSRVHSLNTQFLRVVASAQKRLRNQRRRIALCGLQRHCPDVLRANGLNLAVECYATVGQALETLAMQSDLANPSHK